MTSTVDSPGEHGGALRHLVADLLDGCAPHRAWHRLAASDLTLVGVPESAGGSGGDLGDAAAILGAASGFGLPLPLVETAWLAGWLAAAAGRSAPRDPVTFAVATGVTATGTRLSGSVDVPWRHHSTRAYLVLPALRQVAVVPLTDATDPDDDAVGLCRGELVLSGTPVEDRFDVPDDLLAELTVRAALARTVQIAGACAAVRDLTVRYAGEREQFGRPLSRYQVIQHQLAALAAEAHAVGVASGAAVAAYTARGHAAWADVRAAKAVASAAVERVTGPAHQVFGAIGTTREHGLHQRTMALWDWREDAGNEYDHGRLLGERALRHQGAGVWDWLVPTHEKGRAT
jgi:acyl-CoA dehydrogenase